MLALSAVRANILTLTILSILCSGAVSALTFQGTGTGLNQNIRLEITQGATSIYNLSFNNTHPTYWMELANFTPAYSLWNYNCSIIVGGARYTFPDTKTTYHNCGDTLVPGNGTGGSSGNATPAGNNTQVQFNNNGIFGADANFTFDKANDYLTIGTNTTTTKAQVMSIASSASSSTVAYKAERYSSDTSAPQFWYLKARGTPDTPLAILAGDVLFNIGALGYNGSSFNNAAAASVRVFAEENFGAGRGTNMRFTTTSIGTQNQVERIRIRASGQFDVYYGTNTSNLTIYNLTCADNEYLFSNGTYGVKCLPFRDDGFNIEQYPLETLQGQANGLCEPPAFSGDYVGMEYHDSVNECLVGNFEVPYDYEGGETANIYLGFDWISLDTTPNDVDWKMNYRCINECGKFDLGWIPLDYGHDCEGGETPYLCATWGALGCTVEPGDKIQWYLERGATDESTQSAFALVMTLSYPSMRPGSDSHNN